MKRIISQLLLSLFIVSSANATNWHVRPGGSDGATGLTWFAAFQTINRANAVAQPGDKVYIYDNAPATYQHFPNPTNANYLNGRITFIGASLDGDPLEYETIRDKISLPAGTLNKSGVTIKGVRIRGAYKNGPAARYDSTFKCTIDGSIYWDGNDNCLMSDIICKGKQFRVNDAFVEICNYDTLKNVTFNTASSMGNDAWAFGVEPYMRFCLFENVKMKVINTPNTHQSSAFKMFGAFRPTFRGCRWDIQVNDNDNTHEPKTFWQVRDSTTNITLIRDTVLVNCVVGGCVGLLNGAGNNYVNKGYVCDSLYWAVDNGIPMVFSSYMDSLFLRNSFLASGNDKAFESSGTIEAPGLMDHNTFIGRQPDGDCLGAGIVSFMFEGMVATGTDSLKFTNNIVNNQQPFRFINSGRFSDRNYGLATGCIVPGTKFKSNYNFFSVYPILNSGGDMCIGLYDPNWGHKNSRPGTVAPDIPWYSDIGEDPNSLWGYPYFDRGGPDTVVRVVQVGSDSLFNPEVGNSFPGITAGIGGTTIGAISRKPVSSLLISHSICYANTGTTDTCKINLSNLGQIPLLITNITSDYPEAIVTSITNSTIEAGAYQTLNIKFNPNDPATEPSGTYHITFSTNDIAYKTGTINFYYHANPIRRRGGGGIGTVGP